MRLVLSLLFFVTMRGAEPQMSVPRVSAEQEAVLGDWLIIGPWTAPAGKSAMDVDFLESLGMEEAKLSVAALKPMMRNQRGAAPQVRNVTGKECVSFGEIFGFIPAIGVEEAAGYALCLLHSDEEREAWLLFGSDAQAAVWLNGERRYESRRRRSLRAYDDAIALPLRRGDNLLLIKAVNIERAWIMNAKLAPSRDAAAQAALALADGFFRQALVKPGQPLEMLVRALPESVVFEARLERYDGTPLRSARIGPKVSLATDGLTEGLYRLVRPEGGPWSRPAFYLGDYEGLHRTMTERCATVTDDRTAINLHALLRRLEILKDAVRAASPKPGDLEWTRRALVEDPEHKAVYAATALEEILGWLQRGEEPFRHRPGLHLRGFRSRIDDQPMYYRVFVPSSYRPDAGPGVPLFIMPQPVFSANRPFLESAFVARHREAEDWARVAEKLGVAILWPGYRVRPYGNPIDFTHFEEALAAVRADYRIDPTRIYLHGYCSTGMFSAMEVVRHPKRYAAVAMVNPVLRRLKGRFDEREDFPQSRSYRAWLQETDPMEAFDPLGDIPMLIMHDEADPDHGPLSQTVELVNKLRAIGGRVQFDHHRTAAPRPIRERLVRDQLAWLCRQRRVDASDEHGLSNAPATVAGALGTRFVVVRATGGDAAGRGAAARWCDEFAAAWQRTTFVPCRIVEDTQLTDAEERGSNLVLVGSATSNKVWNRLADRLPVRMTQDAIEIGGQGYQGRGLSIQAVLAHPEYAGRKLVVIGSADSAAGFGTQELAIDGWFNYAIWSSESGAPRLLAAERNRIDQ